MRVATAVFWAVSALYAALVIWAALMLPGWFLVVVIVWLVATLGYTAWMLLVRWRVPAGDQSGRGQAGW